jgi:hypothetical protein
VKVKDPGTLALAWLVAPLLVTATCTGLGRGVAAVTGLRLGVLTVPTGFFAGVVAMVAALRVGLSGPATVGAAIALALPGVVLWARERRELAALVVRPDVLLMLAAGVAAYLLALAPLVGSGRAGILGYVLDNDPAVHISVVEYLHHHGTAAIANPDSSFAKAATVASSGYPLGGHVWVLFASVLTGLDAFYVWQPLLSVGTALLALAAFGVLRALDVPRLLAAAGGVLVAGGFLPYSFISEGSFKEVLVAASLLSFATLFALAVDQGLTLRRLVPALLACAAGLGTFSMAAAAWFAPAILVALVWLAVSLRRRRGRLLPRRPALGAGLGLAAIAVAVPVVASAASYLKDNREIFASADQVGNLLAPLPFWEAFNVWFSHDYRYPIPVQWIPTWIAVGTAGGFAVVGLAAVLRSRRPAGIALLAGTAAGTATIVLASASIYYEAKAYVVAAPAIGVATITGIAWLWRVPRLRPLVGVAGALLAAGVLGSDAMVYSGVWVTPKDRFAALVDAGRHVPRGGPVLVADREYYAKYLLRDLRPWNSWEDWKPYRGFIWGEDLPSPPHNPDFDDYRPLLVQSFRALIDRRRPGGSRAPGNFVQVYENRYYRVWRRVGPLPVIHLGLGIGRLGGAARLDCSSAGARELLAAAESAGEIRFAPPAAPRLLAQGGSWKDLDVELPGPAKGWAKIRGGRGLLYGPLRPGVQYRLWAQGAFGPGIRVLFRSTQVGEVRGDQDQFDGWHLVGTVTSPKKGAVFGLIGLDRPWYLAGSAWNDLRGPFAFQPVEPPPQVETIPARDVRSLCGRTLDWVEVA